MSLTLEEKEKLTIKSEAILKRIDELPCGDRHLANGIEGTVKFIKDQITNGLPELRYSKLEYHLEVLAGLAENLFDNTGILFDWLLTVKKYFGRGYSNSHVLIPKGALKKFKNFEWMKRSTLLKLAQSIPSNEKTALCVCCERKEYESHDPGCALAHIFFSFQKSDFIGSDT